MNSETSSTCCNYSIPDEESMILSKINLLEVYHNLLSEKSSFHSTSINDIENEIKKIKKYVNSLNIKLDRILNSNRHANTNWKIEYMTKKGVNGGSSTRNIWTTRTLNKYKYYNNNVSHKSITLLNNVISIDKGSYDISITMTFVNTGSTKIRLFNMTKNEIVDESLDQYVNSSATCNQNVMLDTILMSNDKNEYVVQFISQIEVPNYGLGLATGYSDYEKYAIVRIKKNNT